MEFMKVGDVAAQLGVSEQAVRLWCRRGVLPAYRPPQTRQWLIDTEAFELWLKRPATHTALAPLEETYRDDRNDNVVVREARRRQQKNPVEAWEVDAG